MDIDEPKEESRESYTPSLYQDPLLFLYFFDRRSRDERRNHPIGSPRRYLVDSVFLVLDF